MAKRRAFGHPILAMREGPREELVYVACSPITMSGNPEKPDFLATVDVNPESLSYGKVLHQLDMPHVVDEISRLGWNTCMGCYGEDENASHKKLMITCLKSSRIYVVNVAENPKFPALEKVIEDDVIRTKTGLTDPSVCHCLGFGKVMISGRHADDSDKGGFIELSVDDAEVCGRWDSGDKSNVFAHDFWYQLLTHNVIASTNGWGRSDIYDGKCTLKDAISSAQASESGTLHLWDFEKRTVVQELDLGRDGIVPSAVRFLHDATQPVGFVASMIGGGIFRFWKNDARQWEAKKVINIPKTTIDRLGPEPLPAMTVDMVLSLDDKFLFCSNWLSGVIQQYDITETENPKLVGQVNFRANGDKTNHGGLVKGRAICGGPSCLTLSLDGRRLYMTTSLFSAWDTEVYPETEKNGSVLVMVDVNIDEGGLSLNQDFIVDFTRDDDGTTTPVFAKEMRYPGGDCTSDIFLSFCSLPSKQ